MCADCWGAAPPGPCVAAPQPAGEAGVTSVGPAALAGLLREELDREYARKSHQLEILQGEVARLVSERLCARPPGPAVQVERIPGHHAVTMLVVEQLYSARAEAALILPGPAAGCDTAGPALPAALKALDRGVEVRVIYAPALLTEPVSRRNMARKLDAGAKIRTTQVPAMLLLLVDRRLAVLSRPSGGTGRDGIVVGEGLLISVLHLLFEAWWAQAKDAALYLAGPQACPAQEVSAEERILLHLLGDGLKDQTIANVLGVSVRTVRRRVSGLLRQLHAGSRFQAGVLVARRGWL
jgi:DNA-binding CsgD family transcriptional regulator